MDGLAIDVVFTVVGLVILVRAADVFVDGAAGLSRRYGVSPVIVGAVVIGLGTSVPELLVSVIAAANGDASLGVGNVIGSNIANLSLVLAVAALVVPIAVRSSVVRREAPISFLAVAAFAVALQGGLSRLDGVLLLLALVVVLVVTVRSATRTGNEELAEEVEHAFAEIPARRVTMLTVIGLLGTALGAQLLVDGSVGFATELGLSEGFVGLTLVAVGTSLPELVTAVQAARRGEDELIVGNVLGSNVFNSLLVGGAIALVGPGPIDDTRLVTYGAVTMVAVAGLGWMVMGRKGTIARPEAALLLVGYVVAVVVTA
jgi:cation:H+ antiporter